MSSLKSFLITEELKVSHAERYLTYIERYHNEVFQDLKKEIGDSWTKTLNHVSKSHKVHPESKQDALLKNPKATTQTSVSNVPTKIITSRSSTPIEVSPSVKIPLVYSQEEIAMITKEFLTSARDAIEKTVQAWGEIFNYEKKGRIQPWFKVTAEHDEVRLQLAISTGSQESYKTLYAIRVEYGKRGSKLRDFDRVYLVNLIK